MQKGPVNVYAFIGKLSSLLPENKITVVGNGSACVVGSHGYEIKKGQRFITNSAVASMGYDLRYRRRQYSDEFAGTADDYTS